LSDSYLYGFIRQTYVVYTYQSQAKVAVAVTPGVDDYAERLTEKLVAEAISRCRDKGIPVYVVLVQIEGSRLERMHQLLTNQKVPYLKGPDPKTRPDLYYPVDGHWNAKGHAYVADALFEQLKTIGPLHN
jgi:hypothetical protein